MHPTPLNRITEEIKLLMRDARTAIARELNDKLLKTYWSIGQIIVWIMSRAATSGQSMGRS